MTKKIRRSKNYEISLEVKNENFIKPPRNAQRNSLLNKALIEFERNLNSLHDIASRFVPGNFSKAILKDRTQAILSDDELMEIWQTPLMKAMAKSISIKHGDILEIGFGRGVSSTFIQEEEVRSHTIIECNDSVVEKYKLWLSNYLNSDIRLVHGLWQNTLHKLGDFDGIFFHTYPLNEEEYMQYVHGQVTFAKHFFEPASKHLRKGGVFTYFSDEMDSLSRGHQRSLLKYFSEVSIKKIYLDLPEDVEDTWWADTMIIVKAIK